MANTSEPATGREAITTERFQALLEGPLANAVAHLRERYPVERSIRVSWHDLAEWDSALANAVLDHPDEAWEVANDALRAFEDGLFETANWRLYDLPERFHVRVGKSRSRHLGSLVAVEGEIVQADEVENFAEVAALECINCGAISRVPQYYGRLEEPYECMGCEKAGVNYRFRESQSEVIDYRQVVLAPGESNLEEPPILHAALTDDLVDRVGPGDYHTFVGTYHAYKHQKNSILDTFVDVWAIEQADAPVEADKLSPDELQERVVAVVEDEQAAGGDFGAAVATVVDELHSAGVREQEVRDAIDDLLDENELGKAGPGQLMVP